ncbi:hypothetical protein J0H58_14990 [bacterium]|nr:hypothetical protein [bacterium]
MNPDLIPPARPTAGPAVPAPLLWATDFWAQGISIGAEFRY